MFSRWTSLIALAGLVVATACQEETTPSGRRGALSRLLDAFAKSDAAKEDSPTKGDCDTLCPELATCVNNLCGTTVDAIDCQLLCDGGAPLERPSCEALQKAEAEDGVDLCVEVTYPDAAPVPDAGDAALDGTVDASPDGALYSLCCELYICVVVEGATIDMCRSTFRCDLKPAQCNACNLGADPCAGQTGT